MFNLPFRYKLFLLRREQKKLDAQARRVVAEGKKKKDERLAGEWFTEHGWEFDVIRLQVGSLVTQRLLREAENLFLPTPERSDEQMWDKDSEYIGGGVLSPKGMTELRSAIRKERRERREICERWVVILIGLIGALTGLIAVLKASFTAP